MTTPARQADWADAEAAKLLGPCTCDVAYKGRGLKAPDCQPCQDGGDTAIALRAAEQRGAQLAIGVLEAEIARLQVAAGRYHQRSINVNFRAIELIRALPADPAATPEPTA